MGYWSTSLSGASLQLFGDVNPDGSEMLWGDAPADRIDEGVHNLITRLRLDLGRFPTVAEVREARDDSPEIAAAIVKAKEVFAQDIEREATNGEIAAGLAFADTEIALDSEMRRDIVVGDPITWAVMRSAGDGPWLEIDYIAQADVLEIAERDAVSSWSGRPYTSRVYVVRHQGELIDVERAYATKVLPGDKSVEQINAERDAREG
jgi:hypothetical protein